ncbi:hypothetical protein EB001_01930 [bacterium]|nr:hypothetical protein [bacterium]
MMKRLLFDILLILTLVGSISINIYQCYIIGFVKNMYFKQCGTSIITIRETELNKMFDKLEEGSEK